MTFKQNAKMSAQGKHYCSGGKVRKMADGGSVSRVGTDQAPAGVYNTSYDRGYNDYKQTTWPSDKKAASAAGHAAGKEAEQEWAREANRAQVMQQVNYPQKKKRGGKVCK